MPGISFHTHTHVLVCYNNLVKSARKREADLNAVLRWRVSPGAGARTKTHFVPRALLIRRLSELANYRYRARQPKYNFHQRMKFFSQAETTNTHYIPIPFKYNSRLMLIIRAVQCVRFLFQHTISRRLRNCCIKCPGIASRRLLKTKNGLFDLLRNYSCTCVAKWERAVYSQHHVHTFTLFAQDRNNTTCGIYHFIESSFS